MSETLMQEWFRLMKNKLECENEDRQKFDALVMQIYLNVKASDDKKAADKKKLNFTQNNSNTVFK